MRSPVPPRCPNVKTTLATAVGAGPSTQVVGRLNELASIDDFLDRSPSGLHGLLLSGPAGVGKTTVWKAALGRARERGFTVLASRPTEVETQLGFSALIDLFAGIADDLLPELPEPQRAAIEVALLRVSTESPPAPLGISVAVLGMIRAAAARGPLLIAIDDAPWLDESSARSLEFALRRLEDAPVALLVAQRTQPGRTAVPPLIASIAPERRIEVDVAPLSFEDTADVVERSLGLQLRRPTLVRIHRLSAGNPFYALEIGRALQRRQDAGDGDVLPVPESLEALVRDRIDAMPPATAEVALYAAALSHPTLDILAAALEAESVETGLAAGIGAGVLDVEGRAIRFTHPLLAAGIYRRADAETVGNVHRRLASVIPEPEERGRHLARATHAPDADVAAALEEGATTARARGAGVAAAELAEAAVRLTPGPLVEERRRRSMAAANYHLDAGDVPRARATLENLAAETPEAERAPILVRLGQVLMHMTDRTAAGRAYREALSLAGEQAALRVRAQWGLAGVAFLTWTDWRSGERLMADAMRGAEELGDPVLLLQTMGHFATWEFLMGRGIRPDLIERAAQLDEWREAVPVQEHPDQQFARLLANVGDTDRARPLIDRLIADARRRDEWYSLPWLHVRMAVIELIAGNWDTALQHVEDAKTTTALSGQEPGSAYAGAVEVELHARRGDVDACREAAARYRRMAEEMGLAHVPPSIEASLALLELSLGNAADAYARLEPLLDLDFPGQAEPSNLRPAIPLAVEALIGLGRLDEAEALLTPYEELARQRDRPISIADALHCRALLLAARGDIPAAISAADEALEQFEALGLPFEAARTLLASGEIRRRGRQKLPARESVTRALREFERLGAERWADRARAELGRAGARRTPGAELTETEQRVADLVAAGHTNRQIADALFMSVHTVEAHLTRIYRSLGVRSRTELVRREVQRETP